MRVLLFVRIIVCLEGTKEQCDKIIFQRKIFNVPMIKKKWRKGIFAAEYFLIICIFFMSHAVRFLLIFSISWIF